MLSEAKVNTPAARFHHVGEKTAAGAAIRLLAGCKTPGRADIG
jgi:hypothetical protein